MARRSQPYRLRHPLSAQQVENIDEMFQLLYDDTQNGKLDIRASQIRSGTLGVTRGGTGLSTIAKGSLLYASALDTIAALPDVATGSALISGGLLTAPSWGKIGLTTHVSGTLPVANGGTNITSYAVGDLLYASGAAALSKLADVAAGSYLRSGGVTTAPVWSTVTIPNAAVAGDLWQGTAASTVSTLASVAVGSYLRSAGVTTANVWSTLTLPNASAQGDIFISTATNAMTTLAKNVTATRYLSNTGATNNPAWAQVDLTNGVTGILPVANGGTGFSNATQTYTPTLTNVANLDASGAFVAQYARVGNLVTVSGKFTADPTVVATLTQLRLSLPVASALTAEEQLGGVAFCGAIAGEGARIYADATNDAALVEWTTGSIASQSYAFIFSYQVL